MTIRMNELLIVFPEKLVIWSYNCELCGSVFYNSLNNYKSAIDMFNEEIKYLNEK